MSTPIILVEVQPARPVDGVAEMVRLAGGGVLPYTYLGQTDWRAGITALPTFITSLAFEGGEIGLGGVPAAAQIEWAPAGNTPLAALAGYYWPDSPIAVRIGPEGSDPPIVLSGSVLEATAEGGVLRIALADPAAAIKKPFPVERFLGTGGLQGPAEWDGLLRRRVWGRIWNQPGQPIDKANNIYCFADPLRPIQAIDAVRDKGAAAAALTTQAWAGTAAATFAALQTAAAPAGGGVICPSLACVKWWTQPAGNLTADLKGEIGAGYVETVPAIAARVVAAAGGPGFAAGTVAAAAAARPGPAGWAVRDDNTSTAAMLDDLLGAVSLLWLLSDGGTIVIRQWAWGASVATARSISATRKRVFKPLATRKLGFKRNELPMARGDIAGIVFDAAYADGTPIEALKPAEAAADVTLTAQVVTSNIGSVSVTADYTTGAVIAGLPRVLTPTVSKGGADVRTHALASYAVTNLTGGCVGNVTVQNTAGSADKGRQTITTGLAASGTYDLAISFDGVAQPAIRVTVTRTLTDPPSGGSSGGGGGGTTKSGSFDPTGTALSSTALVEIGRISGLTKAAGETIRAYFSADYETSASTNASRRMSAQWQYSPAGAGSWTGFGTAINGSLSSYVAAQYEASPGSITCNQTAAPADGTYDIRLVAAENSTVSGSSLYITGGTASVAVAV